MFNRVHVKTHRHNVLGLICPFVEMTLAGVCATVEFCGVVQVEGDDAAIGSGVGYEISAAEESPTCPYLYDLPIGRMGGGFTQRLIWKRRSCELYRDV